MARRGHDEGSISLRSDGRWEARISLGYDAAGKRLRKTVYGQTRREVSAKLKALQSDQEAGLPVAPKDTTVSQLVDAWLETSVAPSVRPRTLTSYTQICRSHIVPTIGKMKLREVDARTIQKLLADRAQPPPVGASLSPRSVQYLRAVLRLAFEQAVRWDMVPRNVVTLTDAPKVEKRHVESSGQDGARELLAAFAGHRHECLFTLLLGTGLRIGEALGLCWPDVDIDGERPRLTVRRQLQWIGGEHRLTLPKSGASIRSIPIPAFVVAALRARRDGQRAERETAGAEWTCSDLVFTTGFGTPLGYRNVVRDFKLLLERRGLPDMRLHDLRHQCASLLVSLGHHPRVVMEILGHSQISLTMNTYSHVAPENLGRVADSLDDAIGREKPS